MKNEQKQTLSQDFIGAITTRETETKNIIIQHVNAFWHLVTCQVRSRDAIIKYTLKFKESMKCMFTMF